MPFTTREESIVKGLRPRETAMSSMRIREEWDERIKKEAVFGARITHKAYVDAIKKRLMEIVGGTISPQEAERKLRESLRDLGYTPEGGFPGRSGGVPPAKKGDIRDLSASRRIQLIIDTNVKRARSMGQVAASESPMILMSMPAWKLTRTGARKKPRGDWKKRWAAAGAACGWKGALKRQMVALKTSPIWQSIADGAGGFNDTLGSPYPPFAFGSGLAWVNVRRKEWQRMCAEEGVPDGLESITSAAKEYARKPKKPVKIDIEVPAVGEVTAHGVDNPLTTPPAGQQSVQQPTAQQVFAYTPRYANRDKANSIIDESIDAIKSDIDTVAEWKEEIGKRMSVQDTNSPAGLSLARYSTYMDKTIADLRSLEGRVVNYGASVETVPEPRSGAEQEIYDADMDRLASSARTVARKARSLRDSALLRKMAADRVDTKGK